MIETVSVVIPNYNRGQLLQRTIRSVLEDATASGVNTRIIVVDDGSTDNSFDVANSFGGLVTVVRQKHLGSNIARNHGLNLAGGDYIRFVDSDDWLSTTGVTKRQIELLKHSKADVCSGNWLDSYDSSDGRSRDIFRSRASMTDPVEFLLDDQWYASFCYLFRREVVLSVHGWTEDLPACQDFDFILRIALNGSKFISYDGVIGHYYHHLGHRVSRDSQYGWCDCRLRVINHAIVWLNDNNDWTSGRRRAVANSLLNLGKIYFSFNRSKFRLCINTMQEVYPEFRPPQFVYKWLVFFFGYYNAERLLQIRRDFVNNSGNRCK